MKLSEYKDDYHWFSGKASDVARAAAFAGIALVWVFKQDTKPVPQPPRELLLPAALFALGLAVDIAHYVAGTIIWHSFYTYYEKKYANDPGDPELTHSVWWPRALLSLFYLKLACVLIGYVFATKYIFSVWFSQSV